MNPIPLSKAELTPEFIRQAEGDQLRWAVALCKAVQIDERHGLVKNAKWGRKNTISDGWQFYAHWYLDGALEIALGPKTHYQGPDFLSWDEAGRLLEEMPACRFERCVRGKSEFLAQALRYPPYTEESADYSPTIAINRSYCLWKISESEPAQ